MSLFACDEFIIYTYINFLHNILFFELHLYNQSKKETYSGCKQCTATVRMKTTELLGDTYWNKIF